jgi:hypothetical protein
MLKKHFIAGTKDQMRTAAGDSSAFHKKLKP